MRENSGMNDTADGAESLIFRDYHGLDRLPAASALFVCGAGGKTTLIHELRDLYLRRGFRVVVTTSTHMMNEGGLCATAEALRTAISAKGYAFAGRVDPKNAAKIIAPVDEVIAAAWEAADILLVEADGSRHMPFKVPYAHEPVIWACATHTAVVYGRHAAGKSIREACYNPEGVAAALGVPETTILTEDAMLLALRKTYGEKFRREIPQLPVVYLPGAAVESAEKCIRGCR